MNLATCYNYRAHTIYTDGRLYKAGELVGTYKTEAAAKAQATIRSRASNNARAAEHHANLTAIWERKQWRNRMTAREQLEAIYLQWVNEFLSVGAFAEYHGITDAQAADLITLARDIFNTDHPEA